MGGGQTYYSLMETAVLKVTAGRTKTIARALLDGGASLCLATSRLATLLGAKKIFSQTSIKGIGGSLDTSHTVELELFSAYDREGESVKIHCQVVDHCLSRESYKPAGKQLADPGRRRRIDLVIAMPDIPDCYT